MLKVLYFRKNKENFYILTIKLYLKYSCSAVYYLLYKELTKFHFFNLIKKYIILQKFFPRLKIEFTQSACHKPYKKNIRIFKHEKGFVIYFNFFLNTTSSIIAQFMMFCEFLMKISTCIYQFRELAKSMNNKFSLK